MIILASLAILGVVFGVVYMFSVFRCVMFGPICYEENKNLVDLDRWEMTYLFFFCGVDFHHWCFF